MQKEHKKQFQQFLEVLCDSLKALTPLIIGMLPFAIAFGIFSSAAGISSHQTILMSATVYAGLAQFIVVNMALNDANNLFLLVGLVFVVNLRFLLMGMSLKPYYPHRPKWLDCLLAFGLSDEPYLVLIQRFSSYSYSLTFHVCCYVLVYLFWVTGTAIGVFFGASISDPHALGLDFALCAAFTVMLLPKLKENESLMAALLSCIGTLVLGSIDFGEVAIVLASFGSLFIVSILRRYKNG